MAYDGVIALAAGDREEAVALWQACGLLRPWNDPRADYAAALACVTATLLGVRQGGRLIGSVMAGYDGHRGWLYYLSVAPDRQRIGVGRRLVHAAERWLHERGAPKAQVMVRTGNDAGGFYRALGYEDGDVAVMGRRMGEC